MSNKITTGDIKTVGKVANMSGMFVPNDDQKRLKATFWRRWNAGPVRSDDEISAAAITEITDTSVVEKWWKDDKFKSWFKNQDTFSEDADYNANIAIETLRQLMFCDNPSIRLKAASESLKLKSELDKKAIDAENNTDMDAEQMQKLFLKSTECRADIIAGELIMSNARFGYSISFNAGTFAPKKSDAVTTEYPDAVTVIRRFRIGGETGTILASVETRVDEQGRELYTKLLPKDDQ